MCLGIVCRLFRVIVNKDKVKVMVIYEEKFFFLKEREFIVFLITWV